jgi:hypothetical protein
MTSAIANTAAQIHGHEQQESEFLPKSLARAINKEGGGHAPVQRSTFPEAQRAGFCAGMPSISTKMIPGELIQRFQR